MTSPLKPWETNALQNSSPILRSSSGIIPNPSVGRSVPILPPKPVNLYTPTNMSYNTPYSGYSGMGGVGGMGGMGYGGYGMNSYSSYGTPYRSSVFNSYGGYNNNGMYGMPGSYPYTNDDAEQRFVQYAEESSKRTFANVENIVRAFSSIAMMLDNTFFAMTSSFRAVLSVAENFGRLRTMFGHIWYSINIFRLLNWFYKKMMALMGHKVPRNATAIAWKQATQGDVPKSDPSGSSLPTLAFLGVLISAPYIISKFLPKYEDKSDPSNWKSAGINAKAAFDFVATSQSELSMNINDEIIIAPTYIQESMSLKNTGWAYALSNGKNGVVPLNYLVLDKSKQSNRKTTPVLKNSNISDNMPKTHTKRVSFGENQIFDLDDYVTDKKESENVRNKTALETSSILIDSTNKSTDNFDKTEARTESI